MNYELEVTAMGQDEASIPSQVTVNIDERLAKRIREVSEMARSLDLNEANFFEFSPEWHTSDDIEMPLCVIRGNLVCFRACLKGSDQFFESEDLSIPDVLRDLGINPSVDASF
ncbi:hypothetical protein [Thioalkalivibrio sp. ALE19]|uniref:hypothetical protein n=1 Tax=Thioalkalivibrio sp. ALE19 TaxID=1266909 RepID=UPI00041A1566|nr:hypothetical protein [Thioalkalivibrio sp. ALE19]